jgi:hypothetical protein
MSLPPRYKFLKLEQNKEKQTCEVSRMHFLIGAGIGALIGAIVNLIG